MSQALQKAIDEAARLIRDGKVDQGVQKLRPIQDRIQHDRDLNRLGDLLSRAGRVEDALIYYERMGESYAKNGILAKAVAVYKKIIRLVPDHRQAKLQLGVLYLKQNIRGEAQRWLSEAAAAFEAHQEFEHSLKVYETLAAADPTAARHQLKLARARLAAGAGDEAEEALGRFVDRAGRREDSTLDASFFEEAIGLFDSRWSIHAGYVRWMRDNDRASEAVKHLNGLPEASRADPVLYGETILTHWAAAETDRAFELLFDKEAPDVGKGVWRELLAKHLEDGKDAELWPRLDPILEDWSRRGQPERAIELLRHLSDLRESGYVPALERLSEALAEMQEPEDWRRVQARLVRALQAAGDSAAAEKASSRLKAAAAVAEGVERAEAESAESAESAEVGRVPVAGSEHAADPLALAVPTEKAERDFEQGKLTQAEALEKYGLLDQALAIVRELTVRFPGSVPAQERLTRYLELKGAIGQARDAYVALALAKLKAGDKFGAAGAVRQARSKAPLGIELRGRLASLGLIDRGGKASAVPPTKAPTQVSSAGTVVPPPGQEAPSDGEAGEEVSIDFEFEIEESAATPAEEPTVPAPSIAPDPTPGPELPAVAAASAPAKPSAAPKPAAPKPAAPNPAPAPLKPAAQEPPAVPPAALDGGGDEDDLSAIAAALESSFDAAGGAAARAPKSESEQSIDEVFAAFKERVAEEVDIDDHRTHYDLGIAYKEMGLLDEAIREFEISLGDDGLRRDGCTMIAMLYREKQEAGRAVEWYRRALKADQDDPIAVRGLRYDLANLLAEEGDTAEAIEIFRNLESMEPGFRDVRTRIVELEARS